MPREYYHANTVTGVVVLSAATNGHESPAAV